MFPTIFTRENKTFHFIPYPTFAHKGIYRNLNYKSSLRQIQIALILMPQKRNLKEKKRKITLCIKYTRNIYSKKSDVGHKILMFYRSEHRQHLGCVIYTPGLLWDGFLFWHACLLTTFRLMCAYLALRFIYMYIP